MKKNPWRKTPPRFLYHSAIDYFATYCVIVKSFALSAGNFTVYLPSFAVAEAITFPAASFTTMFVAFLSLVTTYLALVAVTVPSFATVTLMIVV